MEASDSVKGRIGGSTRGVRMAFDRFQGTSFGPDSLFSTHKQQACGTGDNGSLFPPFLPLSNFSLPEEPGMPYTPWSVHDDPYQLIECAQNNKSRNLTDGNDRGSEADLYGLVSDILGEADKMDSYYSEEALPNSNSVWSPKCMREDYQQYLQPESKIHLPPPFLPSHAYHEPLNKTLDQSINRDSEEMYQRFTSLDSSEQWLFSSCLEDMNSYVLQNQEFQKPPGLQLPTVGNSYLSKMRQSKHEYSASDVEGPCVSVHSLSDHMEAFQPQNKINSHGFDHYYEDYAGLNSVMPRRFKQYAMQDVNKLACNMQSLMVGEQDNSCARESQSRQTAQMQYEASMAEQRKFTSPRMQAHNTPTMQFHKELGGDFGAVQQETDGGGSKLPLQSEFMSKDVSEFGPQLVEYFQKPKALSTASNPANMYQSKMNGQKGNSSLSMNPNINQFFSHPSQQNQLQNKPKLIRSNCVSSGSNNMLSHSVSEFVPQHPQQTQRGSLCIQDFSQGDGPVLHNREGQSQLGLAMDGLRRGGGDADFQPNKKRIPMAGLVGEAYSGQCMDGKTTKPHTGSHMGEGDKKGLLHNPYLDNQGSMYGSQRFAGGLSNISMGKTSAFPPYMYPVSNPRQSNCHMPTMTSSGFNSRSSLPYGSCVPLTDLCDLLPDSEFAAFSPFDLMGSSAEGLYPGMSFDLRSPRMMRNRGGPMSQLHCHLEDSYDQWRLLEKERKKTEVILTKTYPGRQISTVSSNALPKVPSNPSKVDRLIVDQIRELARVVSLLGKMERLRSIPLHANISSTLDRHQEAIYITQARRKEEFINTSCRQRQGGGHIREDRGRPALPCGVLSR
ncbi:meiosis-specific coiled-coil domain-containing protein MEIOC isoform X2 [Osmerus eperlanus]|uniref:meiosis-specific coiled-coil domain-containing protein MEIOC isoform X2 n=1 Tax=Osmerus eperlanus TaxID=29151 RepID=UPI002E131798